MIVSLARRALLCGVLMLFIWCNLLDFVFKCCSPYVGYV